MSALGQTFYTIGHSNRSARSFVELLASVGVESLVDVRRVPRSSRHPQFSEGNLRTVLGEAGVVYHWAGRQLGGFREPKDNSPHIALDGGFRGYADYMETEAFERAMAQLRSLGAQGRTAVMCAEKEPCDCHRSLIADYLTLRGEQVLHLIEIGSVREHVLSPKLRRESGRLIYDRGVSGILFDA